MCERTCKPGYRIEGSASRSCLDTGKWSGTQLKCVVKDCGKPVTPSCGKVASVDKTTYKGVAKFTCDRGFRMDAKSSSSRKCDTDGKWNGVATKCNIVKCPTLSRPTSGSVDCNGRNYKSKCTFKCNTGYNMKGQKHLTCQDSGVWTSAKPTCHIAKCPVKKNPTNGRLDCTGNHYKSKCVAKCNTGYTMSGSRERTCGADSKWCDKEAKCTVVDCKHPKFDHKNGKMSCPHGTTYNKVCSFSCNTG